MSPPFLRLLVAPALTLTACAIPVVSAQTAAPAAAEPVGATLSYTDAADLVLASPVIVDATVTSATRIKGAEAASAALGTQRFYLEVAVGALLRSPGAMPPVLGYVYDAPLDARGRAPRLKKQRVLIFARPVRGNAGQIQLTAPGSQLGWSPTLDARVRRIASQAVARDAPPAITGIGNAFHVPGSLPGEGETQVFLTTANGAPISLSILRRPGEQPRFAVALSEIVDDAAAAPARETLLWYRLACELPRTLPEQSLASLEPADAEQARADYQFVLAGLGACERSESRK